MKTPEENVLNKVPYLVVFTECKDCPPELVAEFAIMPSGDIVVRVNGNESYWFNKEGKHPKSFLVFKGE